MSGQVVIRSLEPDDAAGCDAVVASLPYHFGDPHGRAECAQAVRTEPGLTAAEFRAVLVASTLAERRPADEPERLERMLD
mgnify:CR=1 FL=1